MLAVSRSVLVALSAVLVAAGCSSGGSGTPSAPSDGAVADPDMGDAGMGDTNPGSDTNAPPGDSAPADDTAATKPATPALAAVMPMSGALHVSWKLNDTALTGVELWRKNGTGAYAKAYSLPGSATSQHDMKANDASMTYCYQVKTLRGAAASELSPEMCGHP